MNKPLKYALLGLGGLLLLAIAAAAVFALTFDPNRYKGQIERLVKDKTGRTLELKGDLALAFWPSLGAKVEGVALSERSSSERFLSLDSAHASVKLMPLLGGQAIVDGIRVSGLRARVVKEKDGTFNFSDLLEAKSEAGKAPQEPGRPRPAEGEVAFDIASIDIDRSAVSYLDKGTGQQLELSDFRLQTGRIAERASGDLELGASVKGKDPDLDLKVSASGGYRVDLPDNSFALSKFEATLAGMASGQKIDARLASPELVVAKDRAKGELTANLKSNDLQASFKLAGLEGSAKALVVSRLSGDVAMKDLKASLNGSLRADLEKESASADLTAKLDESNIKAKLGLARFSPPAYRFDVAIDQLNVDKYFPPEPQGAAPQPAETKKTEQTANSDTPIDFSALKGLDADGQLQVGAFQARGLKLANLKAKVHAANGRLDVNPHSADLYEGSLSGALGVQAQGNRVTLKETLTGVSIGPLLREFADKDLLEGRGNVTLDVTAAGASVEQMKKSLAGSAKVALRDGAIKGINLAERVRQAKAMLSGGGNSAQGQSAADKTQKTDFSELNASFAIKGGVAHNEDLDIKSPLFRIGGKGDVDVGNSRLDYTTRASVVATTKGQGGEDLEKLRGLTVPVRLYGPFADLKYDVDYSGAARDALKSKAGERVKEQVEERKDELKERLGDKLKGLLGR